MSKSRRIQHPGNMPRRVEAPKTETPFSSLNTELETVYKTLRRIEGHCRGAISRGAMTDVDGAHLTKQARDAAAAFEIYSNILNDMTLYLSSIITRKP